jgi:RNA polymerase sigma-70 factor, ECF subfamily
MSEPAEAKDAMPAQAAIGAGPATEADARTSAPDFEALVARFESPLLRYAGRILGRIGDEAQDVVQEAFLRLHQHLAAAGPAGLDNPACWLFRVAHNLALDVARKRDRHRAAAADVAREAERRHLDATAGAEAAIEAVRREARERALAEVDTLPEPDRHILLLKVIQGLTLREIAEITGLTTGNVDYKLNQALRELARRLKAAGIV